MSECIFRYYHAIASSSGSLGELRMEVQAIAIWFDLLSGSLWMAFASLVGTTAREVGRERQAMLIKKHPYLGMPWVFLVLSILR